MLRLWIPTVFCSFKTNNETTLTTERSVRLLGPGVKSEHLTAFPTHDKETNSEVTVMPECFFELVSILQCTTMNQTAAEAINKDRRYGNESAELVRSPPSCMLSHDSGAGILCHWVIDDGSRKKQGGRISLSDLSHTHRTVSGFTNVWHWL